MISMLPKNAQRALFGAIVLFTITLVLAFLGLFLH